MDLKTILQDLTKAAGASGDEREIAELSRKLLSPYGETKIDRMGNVVCFMKGNGKFHIQLDAHMDEIGMSVIEIEDGFLKTAACGGIDRRVMDGAEVLVHGKKTLYGVVTSTPPHLQKGGEKEELSEEITIDVGLSRAELESLVALGDRVTIKPQFLELLNGCVSAPALDDRAGMASLLLAAEEISKEKNRPDVTIVFSTREETTESGAKTAAYHAKADLVVAVDVSFAKTPDAKPEECGILGKGAMIGFSPVLTRERSLLLQRLAKENNLPYQVEVMGGGTGTNCDVMAAEAGGRETALLSIPLRYMHTGIEVVSLEDVKTVGLLLSKLILHGEEN